MRTDLNAGCTVDGRMTEQGKHTAPRARRTASKEERQHQLIEATIDQLALRGYASTTIADVAKAAGLSRGIVNFHFESKERLLEATLACLSREYDNMVLGRIAEAGDRAADQLWAYADAHFDPHLCTPRKLAAWVALWGEAKNRPNYVTSRSPRDIAIIQVLIGICEKLKTEGGYSIDPHAIAFGLNSLTEGSWMQVLMEDSINREEALAIARHYLSVIFPRHFHPTGPRPALAH